MRHSCCRLSAHTGLFMPFASITVSTRECARVRDHLVGIAATKISAGVSTGIGSHVEDIEDKGDDQFEISDGQMCEGSL